MTMRADPSAPFAEKSAPSASLRETLPSLSPPSWLPAPEFDLRRTIESGQVFHWREENKDGHDGYVGLIGDLPVRLSQCDGELRVSPGTEAAVTRYFSLDHPLDEIYATFPPDATMQEALAFCRGIRVIRQPLWECLGTFITSSMKQVKHIRQMSHAVRLLFGREVGPGLYAYPEPERLALATGAQLRACGLGFRAENLLGTARMISDGLVDIEAIREMSDEAALTELCRLPGVGPKIANCVLLFGYERVRAFPIDVWIERVLRQRYFAGKRKVTPQRLAEFAATYFGPYGGYAQQYLFHHARSLPRSQWK